jgi:hypothetical protein
VIILLYTFALMKPETKKRLEEFVERAEKIRTYSYLDGKDDIIGFTMNKVGDNWQVDYYQPSDEQRDALLLHLRLFLQDKDNISFKKLADLCNDPELSEKWKTEFEFQRKILNIRLDQVAAESKTEKITYRDVLYMFLFGKIAHNNPSDKNNKLYHKWVTSKIAYKDMSNTFHEVIIWLLTALLNISSVSKEELQRYGIK